MYQRFWDFLHIKVSNNSSCGRRKRVGKGCHYSLTTPQCHMIQPEKSCTLANLWRMWSPNMQLDIELELSSCGSWQPLKKVHIHHITNILRLSSSQVRRGRSEGQKVHSKSSTHVIEASGGPKDSLNIACPLSVSHCISISFTGEQDLQPIQWHLMLTLADNTQHHLVMEKEQWPGLVLVMWWWQCWWVPRYPSTGHTQPTGWHTGPSAEAAPPTHPRTITHPPTVLRLVTLAPHITLGSISSWLYIWYSFLMSWIYLHQV